MVFVFLTNENIISHYSTIILSGLLLGLTFYFVPYRMLKNREVIISKGLDIVSNLIMGATCGYINVLLFTNSPNVITFGQVLVIVSSLFSYYILYIKKEHSNRIFLAHFIVSFFLIGLLQFIK